MASLCLCVFRIFVGEAYRIDEKATMDNNTFDAKKFSFPLSITDAIQMDTIEVTAVIGIVCVGILRICDVELLMYFSIFSLEILRRQTQNKPNRIIRSST